MRPLRLVLLALLLLTGIPLSRAAAQTGKVDFVVTAINPYTGRDRPLDMEVVVRNIGDTPVERAAIRLTLHDRVRTRSELRQALDGNPRSDVLAVTTETLEAPLEPGERRVVKISRDLGTLASPFRSPDQGVYPIGLQLRIAGDTVDESATAVPFFFEPPAGRLNVAMVLPIHVKAAFDARGHYEAGTLDRSLQGGGEIDGLLSTLTNHQTLPVTLAPTALTLDQLEDMGNGFVSKDGGTTRPVHSGDALAELARTTLERFRQVTSAPAFQTIASTYARADILGLVSNGMIDELRAQFAYEIERTTLLLGRPPAADVLAPADYHLDARSAVHVAAQGARTVVLSEASLPERRTRFGYDRPVRVTGGGGTTFTALVADQPIHERFNADTDPVLKAQGVLAETAASYFELPALAPERLLVIAPPVPLAPFVTRPLLNGLAAAPWIQVRTVGDAAGTLPPPDDSIAMPIRRVADRPPLAAARAARSVVATLGSIFEQERVVTLLERHILASESADWITEPTQGAILAHAARGASERTLDLIRVAPRQVTLTSRIAQIPVTVTNETGQPVKVRIVLDSTKIAFPEGSSRTVEVAQRVLTVTFQAETRVTGAFPLTVRILSPDGASRVGEAQLIVRSTAVSAVTLAAVGGGGLVLLAGWMRRLIRKRKRPAEQPS